MKVTKSACKILDKVLYYRRGELMSKIDKYNLINVINYVKINSEMPEDDIERVSTNILKEYRHERWNYGIEDEDECYRIDYIGEFVEDNGGILYFDF